MKVMNKHQYLRQHWICLHLKLNSSLQIPESISSLLWNWQLYYWIVFLLRTSVKSSAWYVMTQTFQTSQHYYYLIISPTRSTKYVRSKQRSYSELSSFYFTIVYSCSEVQIAVYIFWACSSEFSTKSSLMRMDIE